MPTRKERRRACLTTRDHRQRRASSRRWSLLASTRSRDASLPAGPIAVPLAAWQAQRDALLARARAVGVWLAPDDDPAALARRPRHASR